MRKNQCERVQNKTRLKETLLKAPGRLPINPTKPPIPGVAEHRIAKSPAPKWIGAFSVYLKKIYFEGLVGYTTKCSRCCSLFCYSVPRLKFQFIKGNFLFLFTFHSPI